MANVNLQRTSWGFGELDKRMLGRTDLTTYKHGLVKMENWLPAKSGAAVMRGGMEQVKSISADFAADYLIPLRGGASPMLGLYDSTNQKFRAIKADGKYVGTEESPAEVQLFHFLTVVEQDADAADPYVWTLTNNATTDHPDGQNEALYGDLISAYDDKDGEESAADAFYDYIKSYKTKPNASCFKIRLTLGATVQDFSLENGTIRFDEVLADGTGAALWLEPPVPRPDSNIIDSAIAGNVLAYIDHVKITRRTTEGSPTAAKLTLNIHNAATGGVMQGDADTARDITPWEAGGKISVLFNDDPGVAPLWAVEPNTAQDSVTVRIFRPNSDVKCYTITETTITEDAHDENAGDLVGPVHSGKHASHGAYFEQRIVYGGGRNHRQQIVGSRSPNPLTGDRRYGQWALKDETTTSVTGTSTQIFIPNAFEKAHNAWGGGADPVTAGGYVALHIPEDSREANQDFTYLASRRTLPMLEFGRQSFWEEGEAMFHMWTGSLDSEPNEHVGGGETGTERGNGANNGGVADRTGKSNWSRNWELNGRIKIVHGDEEITIQMNNENSTGDTLVAANSTIRVTPAGGNPDLNEQQIADSVSASNTTAAVHEYGGSYYHNLDGGYQVPLHEGNSCYQFHHSGAIAANYTKNPTTGAQGSGTEYNVCKLSSDETAAVEAWLSYLLALDPAPDPASFTITCEIGTTSSTTTTTVNSDNAFQWVIDTGTTHAEVRWLQVVSGVLVAGTSAGIALCKFLNPDDPPEIRWHSSQCVSRKPPLSTPLGIMAVSADRTSVYEVLRKRELTSYSEDRFRDDKISTIAWQQQPQQRLWVVTEAGKIHVLTIQEENGVNGWAQITHQHGGTCTGVVVTNGDDADDTVWFLMKYGSDKFVEKYHEAKNNLQSNRVFMDSAVKRTVGKQTLSFGSLLKTQASINGVNYLQLESVYLDGGQAVLDQRISSMYVGSTSARYLQFIRLHSADSTGGTLLGTWGRNFQVGFDVGGTLAADFIAGGTMTIRHISPLTGAVTHSLEIPMVNAAVHDGSDNTLDDAYTLTAANLTSTPSANVTAFVAAMRAIYPDSATGVAGSDNFTIELAQNLNQVAIPSNLSGLTGKKLHVTSARATVMGVSGPGRATDSAKYETIDSPAAGENYVRTNFTYGEEVWVGAQVIGDMELPAIEQSISRRAAGSWLGQPSRIPWTVAGVEKSHSVKIGPTYDKLVEYFADTTTLSFTAVLSSDFVEPYIWTPSNSAESIAWLAAIRAEDGDQASDHPSVNLYTVSLTAGGVTETFVPSLMGLAASQLSLNFRYRASGTYSNLIGATIGGSAGDRRIADVHVKSDGVIRLYVATGGEAGDAVGDHSLSSAFESGGTITVTRTQPAPLVTGHERRPLPGHVTTTEPLVIRKDTPSPCTMTYMVVEATTG